MIEVATIVVLAAALSTPISIWVGAGWAYCAALTLYLAVVLAVLRELLPKQLRAAAELALRGRAERRRKTQERRAFERNLYRAMWG